ncbi:MAG TPA: alpha/beta fold hydrolase [Tepidisphaeraceae bacterium]|nr:alpha/beta fold hydrolase [Tepidisphaeraceae bacterium]
MDSPEPDHSPRLILFPGLAADARLFEPQRRAFPGLEVFSWLMPLPEERIESYARRMAAEVTPDERPMFLGGVSFGAVIALEAARHLPAAGIFLIGGGLSARMITWPFRWMCYAAPLVPLPLVPWLLTLFPIGLDVIEKLTDEQKQLYVRMSRDTPPAMIRWGAHAMTRWEFAGPLPEPVHAIHGHDDRIVHPDPRLSPRVVQGGRHLISLSHPEEVNAFIAEKMGAVTSTNS